VRAKHPKALEVRNTEIDWLLAVDELATSLRSLENSHSSKGRTFVDSAREDLKQGIADVNLEIDT
jgi:hypothetical protein